MTSESAESTSGWSITALGAYAQFWWEDTCSNIPPVGASHDEKGHFVRRQIVFAICCVESWFFEWVRDDVLDEFEEAEDYFDELRSVPRRIKEVCRELYAQGELANEPEFGKSATWDQFIELLKDRNGLVHAVASRPYAVVGELTEVEQEPRPKPGRRLELAPAGPAQIVLSTVALIAGFDDQPPPDWMELPDEDQEAAAEE